LLIDVHTHIFPREIIENRQWFFSEDPVFKSLYGNPKATLATAETLLASMDENGIAHSVTFGFPWRNHELAARHNDYVLESAAKYAPRLLPLGCVNPLSRKSAEEAERVLQAGARGLGEIAVYEHSDEDQLLSRYKDLFLCCRAHGGVLLVHANEPVGHLYPGKAPFDLKFYYDLARLAAGTPLVMAHWGGGLCFFELLKKEAKELLANVYYDTAASPFLYRPEIYPLAMRIVGRQKVLFGSDYPLLSPQRYFDEMQQAGLQREDVEAIGGLNAARLFGLTA